jgi:hypothetical protein
VGLSGGDELDGEMAGDGAEEELMSRGGDRDGEGEGWIGSEKAFCSLDL